MGILRRLIDCLPYVLRGEPVAPPLFAATEAVYLARACYVAAELGIADLVENRPQTAAELAARTGCDELALLRVLRTLAAFDLFAQDARGRFRLSPRGAPLASDRPDSQRHWTLFRGHRASCEAAARFLDAVKTGKNAFEIAHGKPFFDYCRDDPYLNEVFIKGMSGWTDWQAREVVRCYDFGEFGRVVDVGGGRGSLLLEVLEHNPAIRGVLYDLPTTVAEALPRISSRGLEHRCEVRGGNFLQEVPEGGRPSRGNTARTFCRMRR
ncbi:MAG: acetylserotonin O-methyltransferase, partial [Thermoguttaceae bacterium]|nr:acetylserotonin O-methyltransferase [Thermoguttaceae bacterium]